MGDESSRVLTRSAQADVQMSDVQKVQVTGYSRPVGWLLSDDVPRMREGIRTRQPWECGRPRGLQHWNGVVARRRTFSHGDMRVYTCRHAVMDEKSAQIEGGGWAPALRRWSIGPNQLLHAPPRGLGDTWELGPRRYPFVLVRCLSATLTA